MTDPTVAALRQIKSHAASKGAVLDRVEVFLREQDGRTSVEFIAYLLPRPLDDTTACCGYTVDSDL